MQTWNVVLVCILGAGWSVCASSLIWTSPSSPLLPEPMAKMAVGYNADTESVWLIGGGTSGKWLIEYNTTANNYTIHADLPEIVVAYSQSWTQRNNLVYMLTNRNSFLQSFDVSSQTFVSQAIEWNGPQDACLAHDTRYLFAVGGTYSTYDYALSLLVYEFATNRWTNGTSLLEPRAFGSCQVVNGKLYLIGGFNRIDWFLESVHVINVQDVQNMGDWVVLNDTLSRSKTYVRSVVHGELIYVLGGWITTNAMSKDVEIIDTTTDTISFDSQLVRAVDSYGAVVTDSKVFVFGGDYLLDPSDKLQCAELPVSNSGVPNTTTLAPTDETTTSLHSSTTMTVGPTDAMPITSETNTALPTVQLSTVSTMATTLDTVTSDYSMSVSPKCSPWFSAVFSIFACFSVFLIGYI